MSTFTACFNRFQAHSPSSPQLARIKRPRRRARLCCLPRHEAQQRHRARCIVIRIHLYRPNGCDCGRASGSRFPRAHSITRFARDLSAVTPDSMHPTRGFFGAHTSHVTRHTSHVTRHTSHVTVTRHTTHVTRHTSHVTRHTSHTSHASHASHVTRHTSHFTRHTSHLTPHTSHLTRLTPHTSHLTHYTAYFTRHTHAMQPPPSITP